MNRPLHMFVIAFECCSMFMSQSIFDANQGLSKGPFKYWRKIIIIRSG